MQKYKEKTMERLNSGESKTIFRNISCIVIIGVTTSGRKVWQDEEETRKDTSIVLIRQEQSCTSELFKVIQDVVDIPSNFFQYIYHVGCAINLHSIINSGLILGGQNLSNRQTVFFLPMDPMDKNHKDPDTIDLNAPRHEQYMHKAWKKHQNTEYWVDINLGLKKGLKFYQTRSNAIILHETLPAYCIPKVVRMKTGEVMYEKVYASPRPPPKISLKHDWKKELGPEVAQRPDGQVVQQSKSSQSNQPNPNPDHDRTVKPVVCRDASHAQDGRKTSRSQEIETRSFHEEAVKHDRTGKPVVGRDASHAQGASQTRSSCDSKSFNVEDKTAHDRTEQPVVGRDASHAQGASQTRSSGDSKSFNVGDETIHDRMGQPVVNRDASHDPGHEQTMLNEVNIDFRIRGLPHSVVKQAQNSRVRELVKKIENHPHRHSLQRNLQQNEAYNPFSTMTKQMIQDVGNVELLELFETNPKTQCTECLSYWSEGIVYCTCGHLSKELANRNFVKYTMDFLPLPECVIKKGRPHGHRYGKTPEKKEYHLAQNLKKRCIKRGFTGIHDRYLHVFS